MKEKLLGRWVKFGIIFFTLWLSACYQPSDKKLGIKEMDGVPVFWEFGMPYFTRFQNTSHIQLNLAGIWKFQLDPKDQGEREGWFQPDYDDGGWFEHPVPGSWNTQKPEWLNYVGVAWYRKKIIVPKEFSNKFNRLVLGGVSFRAKVYLNGKFLGYHSGGFSQWSMDLSDLLKYGEENLLAIKVDNQRNWDELPPLVHKNGPLGFWPYGGIHHLAMIESGPQVTACKLAVSTDETGQLNLQIGFYNHSAEDKKVLANVYLEDLEGNLLATLIQQEILVFSKEVRLLKTEEVIQGIEPWSPEHPENRYRLVVSLLTPNNFENQSIEIGFRRLEIKENKLFFNGKPIYLRGVNRHEDDPITGRFQTEERIAEDISLLKELNVNLVRTAHYPNDPRFLDALDRAGILVMEEIPLHQVGWEYSGIRSAERFELFQNASRELLEMIERDRNHPSLVIYSLGDESFTFLPSIRLLHKRLYQLARRFDYERPITMAIVTVPYRITPWPEMTAGIGDLISVNEYYGWYYGKLEQLSAFLDALHQKWPEKPIIISELGAEGVPGLKSAKLYPIGYGKERDFGEEYQLKFLRSQLATIKTKPYLSGVIIWVFADHRDDKRPLSAIPLMNTKGILTYDRKKKQAFELVKEFYQDFSKN